MWAHAIGVVAKMSLTGGSVSGRIKTDSVQSSSNTCKNYLIKIYSQHANFLNALLFSSLSDPTMKSPSILEKFNVKLRKNVIVFTTNAKCPF